MQSFTPSLASLIYFKGADLGKDLVFVFILDSLRLRILSHLEVAVQSSQKIYATVSH